MKKSFLIFTLIFTVGILSTLFLDNLKADEVNLYQGALWVPEPGDCSVIFAGQGGLQYTFLGITRTLPASGQITLTFSGVSMMCKADGDYMCEYNPCSKWWKGESYSGVVTGNLVEDPNGPDGPL